jgi:sugar phosphate isomerase/epimerase
MRRNPNRRAFLRRVSLATVALVLPTEAVRTEPPRANTIPLGFSLYGMKTLSLDAGLEACASIGYDAVELPVMPDWPAEPKRLSKDDRQTLRRRLADLKLSLPALMENLPPDAADAVHQKQTDRLKAAVDLGSDLVPDAPPLIETVLGGKVGQWAALKDLFVRRVGDWAKVAEGAKTVLAVKPHRFGAMNTPEQSLWLVKEVGSPWVRLAYDYSHFAGRDLSLADTLKTMLPQTRFVHVKDVRVEGGKAEFLLPGEGTTDYVALLKGLKEGGYAGCVCVEVSAGIHNQQGYDPLTAAKKCYEALAPAFAKADIQRR